VLGNTIRTTVNGDTVLFGWMGTSGRPPTAQERAEARAPYQPASVRRRREQEDVPDELLAEEAAIEAARREQEREPADLVGRIAAKTRAPIPRPNPLNRARGGKRARVCNCGQTLGGKPLPATSGQVPPLALEPRGGSSPLIRIAKSGGSRARSATEPSMPPALLPSLPGGVVINAANWARGGGSSVVSADHGVSIGGAPLVPPPTGRRRKRVPLRRPRVGPSPFRIRILNLSV
jgi:hypothetical protein